MSAGIPMLIRVPVVALEKLEAIQKRTGTAPRDLIVAHLLAELGLADVQPTPRSRDRVLERMIKLRDDGYTYDEIAKQLGVHRKTVSRRFVAAGIRQRAPRGSRQP